MDWSWAVEGVTEEVPRTTGTECVNYMTNRRRWVEAVFFTILLFVLMRWAVKRMDPIVVPPPSEVDRPHSAVRLMLLIAMTLVFGIEIGYKFAGKSVIFLMNPCHIQTMIQIYLLASKPSKTTIALFRIQMNNLNGPFLAFVFPEVESRTLPFEQTTYWIQHALLYIIPVYIIRSGAYKVEDLYDYNWITIGVTAMLIYHFVVLNAFSILTDINLNHMLCAALADPFQGQNYRVAAVIHESILCPILNKVTVFIFSSNRNKSKKMPLANSVINTKSNQTEPMVYHQLQNKQYPRMISTQQTSNLATVSDNPITMSMAGDTLIAATVENVGNTLKHRQNMLSSQNEKEKPQTVKPITSEYTMQTTKID